MTVWRYPISWSKLKMAFPDGCQLQLRNIIDKRRPSDVSPNYYMELGSISQYVFELYFNQKINQTPQGRTIEVMEKVVDKVLASAWFKKTEANVTYPPTKNDKLLKITVKEDVLAGFKEMERIKMLDKPVLSEKVWNGTFRNVRTFAKIDFMWESASGKGWWVWDGKGHAKPNADPRQLLYYALTLMVSGQKVAGGGLIYWRHGVSPVPMTPKDVKDFVDKDLTPAVTLFNKLHRGTEEFTANPSADNCKYCSWKSSCKVSHFKKEPQEVKEADYVGFAVE